MANGSDNITIGTQTPVSNITINNINATDQIEAVTPPTPSTAYDYNSNFTATDFNNAQNIDFNN